MPYTQIYIEDVFLSYCFLRQIQLQGQIAQNHHQHPHPHHNTQAVQMDSQLRHQSVLLASLQPFDPSFGLLYIHIVQFVKMTLIAIMHAGELLPPPVSDQRAISTGEKGIRKHKVSPASSQTHTASQPTAKAESDLCELLFVVSWSPTERDTYVHTRMFFCGNL